MSTEEIILASTIGIALAIPAIFAYIKIEQRLVERRNFGKRVYVPRRHVGYIVRARVGGDEMFIVTDRNGETKGMLSDKEVAKDLLTESWV